MLEFVCFDELFVWAEFCLTFRIIVSIKFMPVRQHRQISQQRKGLNHIFNSFPELRIAYYILFVKIYMQGFSPFNIIERQK